MKRTFSILFASAVLGLAGGTGTYAATAAGASSSCTVSYVGDSWGPLPLWRVAEPDGSTVDINATDGQSALDAICPETAPADATAPAAPTAPADPVATDPAPADPVVVPGPSAIDQATVLVDAGRISLVGDSWGPVPLWRVTLENGDTIDVTATDRVAARAAAIAALASEIEPPTATPTSSTPVSAPSAPEPSSTSVGTTAPTTDAGTTTAAPPEAVATPTVCFRPGIPGLPAAPLDAVQRYMQNHGMTAC